MIVCIDSMIVVWGIKKQATEGQENMVNWAIDFLEYLDMQNKEALIPELVMAEILATENEFERERLRDYIEKTYRIGSFDSRVADLYAKLMHENMEGIKEFRKKTGLRHKMKFDLAIAATAIIHGCSTIYTHDGDFAKPARKDIPLDIIEMPRLSMGRPTLEIPFEFPVPTEAVLEGLDVKIFPEEETKEIKTVAASIREEEFIQPMEPTGPIDEVPPPVTG